MYPQTVPFPPGARLPSFGDTRVHAGLLISLLVLFLYWFFVSKTKWGLKWRATGNNPGAARRLGLPVSRYLVLALVVGGGVAGLAGIAEVVAIHGRLKLAISPGYGYMGFLVNWLSGGNPVGIVIMAFTVALIAAGGFTLQITQRVPYAAVNILLALILFVVLAKPWQRRKG
jgi:simple sugar transport system permease protein